MKVLREAIPSSGGAVKRQVAIAVYQAVTEIANEHRRAVEFEAARKDVAELAGVSVKTVDRCVKELEAIGLVEVTRRAEDGLPNLWTLLTPGEKDVTADMGEGQGELAGGDQPAPPSLIEEEGKTIEGRSSARAGRPPGMKAKEWQEFWDAIGEQLDPDLDADPLETDAEMVVDALELLRQHRKVDGKVVTPHEMAIAAVALERFNRCFEWQGKPGSSFGLGGVLPELVMRIRDRPSWDSATHVRLVESAWRLRWWEKKAGGRRPSPSVIWSAKSFPQVVQDAADEKKARDEGKPKAAGRRYTRG